MVERIQPENSDRDELGKYIHNVSETFFSIIRKLKQEGHESEAKKLTSFAAQLIIDKSNELTPTKNIFIKIGRFISGDKT